VIVGFLRRLRGLLGIATTWAVTFAVAGTALLVGRSVLGLFFPGGAIFGPRQIIVSAVEFFVMGGLAGTLFSLFFAGGERRQTLETLSLPRVALWGFLGVGVPTAALSLGAIFLYGRALLVAPLTIAVAGAMGSAMSVATIKLARRAPALPERTEI
jgi:hypothetical protein